MNVKGTLGAIFCFATIALIADSTVAKEVDIKNHSKKQVKDSCQAGGAYWPTSAGGTYGCMNPDGSGIVCGGVSAKDKKTCSTFRTVPPRIPTRDEIRLAAEAEITQGVQ